MRREMYIQSQVGDVVCINGNRNDCGKKGKIVKFLSDRSSNSSGYWGGYILIRFEDGVEKAFSHRIVRNLGRENLEESKNVTIPKAQYNDMQKRIIDLGKYDAEQIVLIQSLIEEGLQLTYSIVNASAINGYKTKEVIDLTRKYTDALIDAHNKHPLADDELCRCGHPASRHYAISTCCLVDGCHCMDYNEV